MKHALLFLLLLAPLPALAETPAPRQQGETVVCRSQPVLGARTRTELVCATEKKWREVRREAANRINDLQTRALLTR